MAAWNGKANTPQFPAQGKNVTKIRFFKSLPHTPSIIRTNRPPHFPPPEPYVPNRS